MADTAEDSRYMDRAIELAGQGVGRASPNPLVGVVLVRKKKVVGEGFHTYDNVKHAEVLEVGTRVAGQLGTLIKGVLRELS